MDWDDRDVVEIFGDAGSGRFLDTVRDPATGEYLIYVDKDGNTRDETFYELLAAAHPDGGPRGRQPVFAVLDTGVLHDHPSIRGRVLDEVDFTGEGPADRCGHGTMVSLLAVQGLDPDDGRLLNVKVADGEGRGSPEHMIRGLEWVAAYQHAHPELRVIVNISAGVYRRRAFGLLRCDGACDVCTAALLLSDADIPVFAAAGSRRGLTACPALAGLRHPGSTIVAGTITGATEQGVGSVAVDVADIPRPARATAFTVLSGADGDTFALKLARNLVDQGDLAPAEKAYRQVASTGTTAALRAEATAALGIMFAAQGRVAEAEPLLRDCGEGRYAQASDAFRGQCLYTLGRLCADRDEMERATGYMLAAIATGEVNAVSHAAGFLAREFLAAGLHEEALPFLELAATGPDPAGRAGIQKR